MAFVQLHRLVGGGVAWQGKDQSGGGGRCGLGEMLKK
jgi:hypothetical protein